MLPLILNDFNELIEMTPNNFYGIYYEDTNRPDWGKKIILVYENILANRTKEICNKNKYYFGAYTEVINDKSYRIISFVIPPEFRRELDNILNGKYESTTNIIRDKILDFWNFSPVIHQKLEEHFLGWQANWRKPKITKENLILNLNQVPY